MAEFDACGCELKLLDVCCSCTEFGVCIEVVWWPVVVIIGVLNPLLMGYKCPVAAVLTLEKPLAADESECGIPAIMLVLLVVLADLRLPSKPSRNWLSRAFLIISCF